MLLKRKSLRINIWKRDLIITFIAIGLSLVAISFPFTASMSSWLRILVYKDFIFINTGIVSFASSRMFLTLLIKSGVP